MKTNRIEVTNRPNVIANSKTGMQKYVTFCGKDAEDSVNISKKTEETETQESQESQEIQKPKRSLTAKKWGLFFAGPFAGNLINGSVGKAFAYLGAMIFATAVMGAGSMSRTPGSNLAKIGGALGAIAIYIVGTVDTIKNAKPEKE